MDNPCDELKKALLTHWRTDVKGFAIDEGKEGTAVMKGAVELLQLFVIEALERGLSITPEDEPMSK